MKYIATGRVHPERANVNFPAIEWNIPEKGRVVVNCDSSQISVSMDLSTIDGWATAYNVAGNFASMIIGALGFSLGSGYSIEITQVIKEDGTPLVFGVRQYAENPTRTLGFDPFIPIFTRAFNLSNHDIFFRLALIDFLRAINDVNDCAMYCYRAIESIKSAFVFASGNDSWDEMHLALGSDKNTIESKIKSFADPIRHGNWVNAKVTDGKTRWEMLEITKDILWKYLNLKIPEEV